MTKETTTDTTDEQSTTDPEIPRPHRNGILRVSWLSPEDAEDDEIYAFCAGPDQEGEPRWFVRTVDASVAADITDNSRHVMVDSSIIFPLLDPETQDELFVRDRDAFGDPDDHDKLIKQLIEQNNGRMPY